MTVNPDGTPGAVAPGELIDAEWGNAVANTIQGLRNHAPVGSIFMWMAGAVPSKFLTLQGGTADRTVYPDLFLLWGVQFGAGDGTTTFGLPDMRARFPVALAPGDPLFAAANNKGGSRNPVVPAHDHDAVVAAGGQAVGTESYPFAVPKWNDGPGYPGTPGNYLAIPDNNVQGNGDYDGNTFGASAGTAHTHLFSIQQGMSLTGGGRQQHGHNLAGTIIDVAPAGVAGENANLPPYIVINFIVKAQKG